MSYKIDINIFNSLIEFFFSKIQLWLFYIALNFYLLYLVTGLSTYTGTIIKVRTKYLLHETITFKR